MGFNIIGSGPKTLANPSFAIPLASGMGYTIPSGQYQVVPGTYTTIQWFDPVSLMWRSLGTPSQSDASLVSSDGTNYRLFNATGTMVGAVITNAGTGYTNGIYPPASQLGTAAAPSVTMSAGGGTIVAKPTLIVGGAINTTVAITAGGANYTAPPILVVSPPPPGGVQATMYVSTLTSGAIAGVTVSNQGAGYTSAPTVTIVPATGDSTGSGAVLTVNATLVGSGTVTAITIQGNVPNPITGVNTGGTGGAGMTTVPTFTFAPASTTAATAVMCFTVTTINAQTAASNMASGNIAFLPSTVTAGSSVLTNPAINTGIFTPRMGVSAYSTTASGSVVILDGGLHQIIVPGTPFACLSNGTISAATTAVAATMGGVTDLSYLVDA